MILILIGLSIFFKHHDRKSGFGRQRKANSQHWLDAAAIFGGIEKIVTSDKFQGGKITTIFGGAEIDMGKATLSQGENVIDIFTIFGGTEIFVPNDWNVVIKCMPVFGACEDSRRSIQAEELSEEKKLVIKGLVLFGGLEIKNTQLSAG